MHISDILKEPSEKLYSRTYRESYKNPCEVAVPLTHIFFHFENSGAVAVPRTHIFFHFQTLVRWLYHSRTYSSIFKLWCGGRTTHAHILPFSKLWCGGRTTHAHILPFQKLWCGGRTTHALILNSKVQCSGCTTHARVPKASSLPGRT